MAREWKWFICCGLCDCGCTSIIMIEHSCTTEDSRASLRSDSVVSEMRENGSVWLYANDWKRLVRSCISDSKQLHPYRTISADCTAISSKTLDRAEVVAFVQQLITEH